MLEMITHCSMLLVLT